MTRTGLDRGSSRRRKPDLAICPHCGRIFAPADGGVCPHCGYPLSAVLERRRSGSGAAAAPNFVLEDPRRR